MIFNFTLFFLWYLLGFISIFISLKIALYELDLEDYIFCFVMAFFGIICTLISITEIITNYDRFKSVMKEIFKRPPPKKLTLKQIRLKKLKKINRFNWFRI